MKVKVTGSVEGVNVFVVAVDIDQTKTTVELKECHIFPSFYEKGKLTEKVSSEDSLKVYLYTDLALHAILSLNNNTILTSFIDIFKSKVLELYNLTFGELKLKLELYISNKENITGGVI